MDQPLSLGISITAKSGAACLAGPNGVVSSAIENRGHLRRPTLPLSAIQHCLEQARVSSLGQVNVLSLQTRHSTDWGDFLSHQFGEERSWIEGMVSLPRKIRQELKFRADLKRELESLVSPNTAIPEILLVTDHKAIARGYSQIDQFKGQSILVLDTPFERAATSLWTSTRLGQLKNLWFNEFPHSLEHLTESLSAFSGFRGRMGQRQFLQLAEYGEPRFVESMRHEIFHIEEASKFSLSTEFLPTERDADFDWPGLSDIFGGPKRKPDQPISSREIDLSLAYVTVVQDWIQSLRQTLRGAPLVVRGQGPTQALLKNLFKGTDLAVSFPSGNDDSAVMAMGAAIEALNEKGLVPAQPVPSNEGPGKSL